MQPGRPAVYAAAGGVEQFSGSAGLVRCFTFWGMELVDVEAAPFGGEMLCGPGRRRDIWSSDLPWFARDLRHKDYLGVERFEHANALRAVSGRHGHDERMPERRANDCTPFEATNAAAK